MIDKGTELHARDSGLTTVYLVYHACSVLVPGLLVVLLFFCSFVTVEALCPFVHVLIAAPEYVFAVATII